jgi:GrpB-like predicted nucleotidyltransferase (UPF0157 family)
MPKDSSKCIKIVPYDPNWPMMFEIEKEIITKALGSNCIAIHHIGSTSIPGLVAKPKIDIIVIAENRRRAIVNLGEAAYFHRGECNIPLKCFFAKRGEVDVNLHVFFDKNHPEVELNLLFRDYLKTHPDIRDEYAAIKMEILHDESAHERVGKLSFPVYTLRKKKFIDGVIKKTGFNQLRILKCLTDEEWNAAGNLRRKYFNRSDDPYFGSFDESNHKHFILYQGTEIVGYAHIQLWQESKTAILHVVAIAESHRDNGCESYLCAVIDEWLIVHGYKLME